MIYVLLVILIYAAGYATCALLSRGEVGDLLAENDRLWTRLHDAGMLDDPMDHGEVPPEREGLLFRSDVDDGGEA